MKYSKRIPIRRKRIKEEDILQLAHIVESEFAEDDYKHHFVVDFWDDSSISDESSEIFKSVPFERKRANRVYIEYYNTSRNRHLEIELYDSTYLDGSEICITSNEQIWYESMITKFTDLLQSVENQSGFSVLFQSSAMPAICSAFGLFLTYLCAIRIANIIHENNIILAHSILFFISVLLLGINFALCFISGKCLDKAFPKVEFCFGPEHMNSGLKIRKAVIWCLLTFTPSLLSYLADILF